MRKPHAKSLKGQSAVEMLATVGLVLLLLIPVLFLLLVGAQVRFESISQIQAASAARIIADSINEVYIEGPGAAKVAVVNIPSNAKNITFSEREVVINLETRAGMAEITYPFFGKLSSAPVIAERRGILPISFAAQEAQDGTTVVMVSYAGQ
ncbi:MAG: hypothetical protein AB1657_01410 [Candidatus Micrarchaeota archaeon]